ncbi:hypothetical protein CLU79DRAFT_391922 [Phycomyces nitens]|nr:hypothetical protein CLU79DRAFT_391922 [Phycomyces nitens]
MCNLLTPLAIVLLAPFSSYAGHRTKSVKTSSFFKNSGLFRTGHDIFLRYHVRKSKPSKINLRQLVRVVKEYDSKSYGLCPRRFKSCSCRSVFAYFFSGQKY